MLNFLKTIEVLISLQSIIISSMIPLFISLPLNNLDNSIDLPITLQIPTIIFISLLFRGKVVLIALTIYLFLGLFIVPIFYQGGSLGYILTPNFGYLIGFYPLIKIIDKLNKKNKINIYDFIKTGILAISTMHLFGIIYSLIQMLYYRQMNLFLYNFGNFSLGKIGYEYLMLLPLSLLIKPINYFRSKG